MKGVIVVEGTDSPSASSRLWLGFVLFGGRAGNISGVIGAGLLSACVGKAADEGGWTFSDCIGRREGHIFGGRSADGVGSL